jgi:hypothetical protein
MAKPATMAVAIRKTLFIRYLPNPVLGVNGADGDPFAPPSIIVKIVRLFSESALYGTV